MPNQAIALGARAPQSSNLGSIIQQNAQMMNQMAQQNAAARQAAQLQQAMEIASAKEARDIKAAEIEQAAKIWEKHKAEMPRVRTKEGYDMWLSYVDKDSPEAAAMFRANLPVDKFTAQDFNTMGLTVDQLVNRMIATPMASFQVSDKGVPQSVTVGGLQPKVEEIPQFKYTPDAQPAPTGKKISAPVTPTGGASAVRSRGDNTAPADLLQQGVNPASIPLGNPLAKPISYEGPTGIQALTPETAPQIIEAAKQNGSIDQAHLAQLREIVGPENDQALADWMQQNNVRIAEATTPTQLGQLFADQSVDGLPVTPRRGVEGATDVGYEPTVTRFKSPTVSPEPGVYNVPTADIRRKAQAERETPEEVYAKELARARAAKQAANEAGPKPLNAVQEAKLRDNIAKDYKSTQSTIDMMLHPVSGVLAAVNGVRGLSADQKEAITGWSGYTPSLTASSRSADTKVANLKGKVTEMGKAAATLTGAIGQMAVQEWKIVSDMIAGLDLEGMEPSDLDNQLDIIESAARRAAAVTKDAYENQYVEEFQRYPGRFQLKSPEGGVGRARGGKKPPIDSFFKGR